MRWGLCQVYRVTWPRSPSCHTLPHFSIPSTATSQSWTSHFFGDTIRFFFFFILGVSAAAVQKSTFISSTVKYVHLKHKQTCNQCFTMVEKMIIWFNTGRRCLLLKAFAFNWNLLTPNLISNCNASISSMNIILDKGPKSSWVKYAEMLWVSLDFLFILWKIKVQVGNFYKQQTGDDASSHLSWVLYNIFKHCLT